MTQIPRDANDRGRETDKWRQDMSIVEIKGGTPTTKMTVNSEGRADVVQHAHPDDTSIHFHIAGLTNVGSPHRYILIDISNVGTADTNYKHVNTDYIHVEWLQVQVDSDNTGDYEIEFGFLENVGAATGDLYTFNHFTGTKTAGNQLGPFLDSPYPNGWRCRKESITTHEISSADADWSNTDTYGDTIDPAGAVACGTGDVVLIITVNTGTIDIGVNIGYHAH